MKKFRLTFTAAAVLMIVGSAMAMTRGTGDYHCRTAQGSCSATKDYIDGDDSGNELNLFCGTSVQACQQATSTIPVDVVDL